MEGEHRHVAPAAVADPGRRVVEGHASSPARGRRPRPAPRRRARRSRAAPAGRRRRRAGAPAAPRAIGRPPQRVERVGQRLRRHQAGRRVDVGEHHLGADVAGAVGGGEEGDRRRDADLAGSPTPSASMARCSAAVPLAQATAWRAPDASRRTPPRTPRPAGRWSGSRRAAPRPPPRCRRPRWSGGRRAGRRRRRRHARRPSPRTMAISAVGGQPVGVGVAGVGEVLGHRGRPAVERNGVRGYSTNAGSMA